MALRVPKPLTNPSPALRLVSPAVTPGWRRALPAFAVSGATVRELRRSDAPSLFAHLTTDDVKRFITPPPPTLEGFERFIAWALAKRAAGEYVCFGIVPHGMSGAVGVVQIQVPPGRPAEWGFVIGTEFWGTGLFRASADVVLEFAFHDMGLERIGAMSSAANGRGNAALRKFGAVLETVVPGQDDDSGHEYYWSLNLRDRFRPTPYRIAGGRP